jgi:hypothetical protein
MLNEWKKRTRPNKERQPVANLPDGALRVCCRLGSYDAHIHASADAKTAQAVVRRWGGPLFKGASFSLAHAVQRDIALTYDDVLIIYGMKAGPARQLTTPIAPPFKILKGGKRKSTAAAVGVATGCAVEGSTVIVKMASKGRKLTPPAAAAAEIRAPHHLDAEIKRLEQLAVAPAAPPCTDVPKSVQTKKAAPAWLLFSRFRTAPRAVARIPGKAVQS